MLGGIFDVFSRREGKVSKKPLTKEFRNRVVMLLREILGSNFNFFLEDLQNRLAYLHGRPILMESLRPNSITDDILSFLFSCSDEHFLDAIEYLFQLPNNHDLSMAEEMVIDQINEFLSIDNLPYYITKKVWVDYKDVDRFGNESEFRKLGEPVRVVCKESEILHQNAIVPTLSLLRGEGLNNVNSEFLGALKDYRHGNYRDALTKSNSALESMMKVICSKRKYKYSEHDVSSKLLKAIMENSDLDTFWEQPIQIIATIRNRYSSSHGAGTKSKEASENICKFVINMTASVMLFLDEKFLKNKR
ncbi:abortive infection family protein [Pseudomonas aeruginosa]|uniref:abortive infection family protein n=1 Tax=Pseudomonas aeruginosa TaxID=287 RepID=UPI000A704DF9|nr:abortive infection family protein [Pseudomonas aeruginosa]EKX9349703.1 abortive infection family protein [Pseudomonas aeruginosa]MBG7511812.1 abortive infection family protein [Pseudomonas aeruginosa]MBH4002968.1 abortive infection family protein [Pseudomonas aeruginosa]MBH4241175.1 abortive infection family protein [Pseudomonas aeruginosa]MBH9509135.1 abortive infection family protein [Pseudomonas aeruginosa]